MSFLLSDHFGCHDLLFSMLVRNTFRLFMSVNSEFNQFWLKPKMQKKSTTQTSNSLACVLCKCKGADEHCHGMFLFSTSESQYSFNSLELTDCVDCWPTTRVAHWKLHILFAIQASPPLYFGNYRVTQKKCNIRILSSNLF